MIKKARNGIRKGYAWIVGWSEKKQAEYALAGLSFVESSFFPIPPDPLLIAMVLSQPKKWLRHATITTVSSVLGGLFGYLLGFLLIGALMPIIVSAGYESAYQSAMAWFASWGGWAVFVAGFTPIPYKIFTIAGGAASMALLPFTIGSLLGRGGRFYLVAWLSHHFGKRYHDKIEKYIDRIGLISIVVVVLIVVLIKLL